MKTAVYATDFPEPEEWKWSNSFEIDKKLDEQLEYLAVRLVDAWHRADAGRHVESRELLREVRDAANELGGWKAVLRRADEQKYGKR